MQNVFDVAIIGAGISGASVAYLLSKYDLSVVLIEKENDVSMGTSRANSAILHAGYDPEPGTLMAKYNARGNELFIGYCKKMNVHHERCGSLVVAYGGKDLQTLNVLFERGKANGVPDMRIISAEELKRMEPNISDEARGALLAPTAGIVNPWQLCLSLAENAVANGVLFKPNFKASVEKKSGFYELVNGSEKLQARVVVNAAGVYSAEVADQAGAKSFDIIPKKGVYYLLDKANSVKFGHVMFTCPNENGKGVLVTPTVHGNLMIGPNSEDPQDLDDVSVTQNGLDFVAAAAKKVCPRINLRDNIRNFAGIRANGSTGDFVIDEHDGFVNMAAMKSPGLTSALAVAEDIVRLVGKTVQLKEKKEIVEIKWPDRFCELSKEAKKKLIQKDSAYGRVICRCMTVTEGEINKCFERPIPPVSVDGVKRRVNAGLGRCQSGFCGPRVLEILSKKLRVMPKDVPMDGKGTYILTGETKEAER